MMVKADPGMIGEGERVERSRRKRKYATIAVLFVIGMVTGGLGAHFLGERDFDMAQPWPPAAALSLAILYVIAMIGGTLIVERTIDEVDRDVGYRAWTLAGTAYAMAYPLWFLLWKGSFVPEPSHWMLFIGFWVVLALASLYYRFR